MGFLSLEERGVKERGNERDSLEKRGERERGNERDSLEKRGVKERGSERDFFSQFDEILSLFSWVHTHKKDGFFFNFNFFICFIYSLLFFFLLLFINYYFFFYFEYKKSYFFFQLLISFFRSKYWTKGILNWRNDCIWFFFFNFF